MADRDAAEGLVVLADRQTAGRGRLGRSWASPSGAGIYASVVLRPSVTAATLLTIAAGVAVAEGIASATGLVLAREMAERRARRWTEARRHPRRRRRWPRGAGHRDQRSVGRILLTSPRARHRSKWSSVVPSIAASCWPSVSRRLASRYRELQERAWSDRSSMHGAARGPDAGPAVRMGVGGERQVGLAENIDEDGALIVKVGAETLKIRSGKSGGCRARRPVLAGRSKRICAARTMAT